MLLSFISNSKFFARIIKNSQLKDDLIVLEYVSVLLMQLLHFRISIVVNLDFCSKVCAYGKRLSKRFSRFTFLR